jgi:hypothetical protein
MIKTKKQVSREGAKGAKKNRGKGKEKTEARGEKKTKDIDHRFFTDEH